MPNTQEIVDEFASLIVGQSELDRKDPREGYIFIARICLQEFIGLTQFGYETGRLPLPDEGQFKEGSPGFQPLHEDDK